MSINSKQRSYLRGLASAQPSILHIGKTGVSPELVNALDEALEARELIKVGVLNNCETPIDEVAGLVKERTRSELVQVIGKKIILYRKPKANKKSLIEFPQ